MPFQKNGKRDYKREAQWEKTKKPSRLTDRVERIQARRKVEAKVGNLPTNMQVDHKTALVQGGSNNMSNLRVVTARTNEHKEGLRKRAASRRK